MRLNIERQENLEPKRMDKAKVEIESLGFKVIKVNERSLKFDFKNNTVVFFPYSGWATGGSIKDGRGLINLLKQLK